MASKSSKKPSEGKPAGETPEQLKRQVKKLRKQVALLESEAQEWRARADKQKSRVAKIRARAEKAIAEAAGQGRRHAAAAKDVIVDHADQGPAAQSSGVADGGTPDEAWTVARLRLAARERSVPGYSRLRKDQLVEALKRP